MCWLFYFHTAATATATATMSVAEIKSNSHKFSVPSLNLTISEFLWNEFMVTRIFV